MTLQLDRMYHWDGGFKKLQWQLQASCFMYLNDKDVVFLQMTLDSLVPMSRPLDPP